MRLKDDLQYQSGKVEKHISEKSLHLFGIIQPLFPQSGAAIAKTGKNAHKENRHIKDSLPIIR
jgi:hypothetical protein